MNDRHRVICFIDEPIVRYFLRRALPFERRTALRGAALRLLAAARRASLRFAGLRAGFPAMDDFLGAFLAPFFATLVRVLNVRSMVLILNYHQNLLISGIMTTVYFR